MKIEFYYEIVIDVTAEFFDMFPFTVDPALNLTFLEEEGKWKTAVESKESLEEVRSHFRDLEEIYHIHYQITKRKQENWNDIWEKSVGTVVIDDFVEIFPAFLQPKSKTKYRIQITPQNAFGTGHHATTFTMMKLMRDIDFKDKEVLDFGCGTGVLGILAHKMGARTVEFIDNDIKCIQNTEQNLEFNDIYTAVALKTGTFTDMQSDHYDIILANVYSSILIDSVNLFAEKTNHILLSGIREDSLQEVLAVYREKGFYLKETLLKDGWTASYLVVD